MVFDVLLNLDQHLNGLAVMMGGWLYFCIFFSIFAETGFVITVFFPSDILVFSAGALAATPNSPVDPMWVGLAGFAGKLGGDVLNYFIARSVGHRLLAWDNGRFFEKAKIDEAKGFFAEFGDRAVFFCRFMPFFRTIIPFIAGTINMPFSRYALYVFFGSAAWTACFLLLGYLFARIPVVQENFHLLLAFIGLAAALPALIEFVKYHRRTAKARAKAGKIQ